MVFLSLRALDRVHTCGCTELFALAYDRGSSILRYHKTRIESGVSHKERRQIPFAADELICTLSRDRAKFCNGYCQKVHYESQGLSVEVAGRYYQVFFGDNVGVVGSRVYLRSNDAFHISDSIFRRTVHLRHTTERVWVLYVCFLLSDYLATFQ